MFLRTTDFCFAISLIGTFETCRGVRSSVADGVNRKWSEMPKSVENDP
jgi:hypothetical protein